MHQSLWVYRLPLEGVVGCLHLSSPPFFKEVLHPDLLGRLPWGWSAV